MKNPTTKEEVNAFIMSLFIVSGTAISLLGGVVHMVPWFLSLAVSCYIVGGTLMFIGIIWLAVEGSRLDFKFLFEENANDSIWKNKEKSH